MNHQEYETMYRREAEYWWYRGMRRIARRFAPELFSRPEGARHLDVACGTGGNLEHVKASEPAGAARPLRAFGVDLEHEGLRFCQARRLSGLSQASATSLPFRSSVFDTVTCHDALQCMDGDETALSEMARLLVPGGFLYVTVAALEAFRGEHDLATHVVRRYSRAELTRKLEAQGLVVERTSYANFFLALPILLARIARRTLFPVAATEQSTSDFHLMPPFLNGLFTGVLYLEAFLVRFVSLPVGVTLLARARKPAQGLTSRPPS